jgi:phosphoenolpyruvate carboxylase
MSSSFEEFVELKFKTYNSLFLDLPFEQTYQTGIYLPLLAEACKNGFEMGKTPEEIIHQFFADYFPNTNGKDQLKLLFRFTQYIERQVLLFDSVEDAAFNQLHDPSGKGSINQVMDLADSSGKLPEIKEKLNEFAVRIVLTAHPTQFYPSQVLGIQNELQTAIKNNDLTTVQELLNQLGKTPFFKKERPSPYEEAVRLTWYLENVFYNSIADIIENICSRTDIEVSEWSNPNLFEVGFWPGGDRDGNPFVTPEITLDVARRLKESTLKCYQEDLRKLRRRLTFRGVEEIIFKVGSKINNTLYQRGDSIYNDPSELLHDLNEARQNLIEHHGGLFLDRLDNLILKIKIFGFFMASLDIRQDSRVHRTGWSQLMEALSQKVPDFDNDHPLQIIQEILAVDKLPSIDQLKGKEGIDLLQTIESIKSIQNENGERGCHRYIISNCKEAIDVAIVYKTTRLMWGLDKDLPLDIIPLFETVDDLATASESMEILFQNEEYMDHLHKRGMNQTIMLGFSDGTKDGGYLQANWSIFKAKEELSQTANKYGVKIGFFDGRGGPPSRGGGNTHNFYAALGDRIQNHNIQLTIQGQTISSHYGQANSCRHNLEQLLTAGLENALFSLQSQSLNENQRLIIEELSAIGYQKYGDLKAHPRFLDYLEKMTTLRFFGQTNVASRPTRRNGGKLSLSDLRAIPFVGSWGQMKQNVPGFYGVGTAIKKLVDQGRKDELINLYQDSLFFRTLLGNSMQSLEKAAFEVTEYISKDAEFGEFWNTLFSEYNDSVDMICQVSGEKSLMTENPDIKKSIRMREAIVLPLVTIQQFALLTLRKENDTSLNTKDFEKLIIRTMFGIINATRNAA